MAKFDSAQFLKALHDAFAPTVRAIYPKDKVAVTHVEFIEEMTAVGGLMYHFCVQLPPLPAEDLLKLVKALDQFCVWDQSPRKVKGAPDYQFQIGDGDDSLAVFYEKGQMKIWLRGWKA